MTFFYFLFWIISLVPKGWWYSLQLHKWFGKQFLGALPLCTEMCLPDSYRLSLQERNLCLDVFTSFGRSHLLMFLNHLILYDCLRTDITLKTDGQMCHFPGFPAHFLFCDKYSIDFSLRHKYCIVIIRALKQLWFYMTRWAIFCAGHSNILHTVFWELML